MSFSEYFVPFLGWIGLYGPMVMGAIGSILGCSIAGQAACGAMLEAESGYGRFVGVAAMPSSQIIYGIVVMLQFQGSAVEGVTVENGIGLFVVGILCGTALLLSAVRQGQCCASAINVSKTKPEVFGLSVAPAAVVEGMAVFAFIFTLMVKDTIFAATAS